MILGLDQTVEREGHDRVDITLPGVQEQFASAILAVGKPTVTVLINGGIIAIDTLKNTSPAIIETFYPGYWGGVAIADVIFGDYNPGGKLPVTYYSNNVVKELDFLSMSMTDKPGRTYRYYTGTPLWEFGYGLSYTTFKLEWSNPMGEIPTVLSGRNQAVIYNVTVTNTGRIAGDEVALAFFKPQTGPLIKQLFGFQRVHLEPNQSVHLSFTMNASTLKIGDQKGNLVTRPGVYVIEFTNGVEERLSTKVEIVGETVVFDKYPF